MLHGVLEFVNSPEVVYKIEAETIIIKGGRLIIGWPQDPFVGRASIILHGSNSPSPFNPGTGASLEKKCIGKTRYLSVIVVLVYGEKSIIFFFLKWSEIVRKVTCLKLNRKKIM